MSNDFDNADAHETYWEIQHDTAIDGALLDQFVEVNPELSADQLTDFGFWTGTSCYTDENGTPVEERVIIVPLYNPTSSEPCNWLVVAPGQRLADSDRPELFNSDVDGIICAKNDVPKLRLESEGLKYAIFVEKLEDVIALTGTFANEGSERFLVFSMDGSQGPMCSFANKDPLVEGMIDFRPILKSFYEQKTKIVLPLVSGGYTRRFFDMPYREQWTLQDADLSIKTLQEAGRSVNGKEYQTIFEFVHAGGNAERIVFQRNFAEEIELEQKVGQIIPKQALPSGDIYCREWAKQALSGEKPKRYTCADEGSPLRQLDPEPGTLTIIGGPTGMFKTSLISTVIFESMYRNEDVDSVLIVNTDQSPESLLKREVSRISGIPYDDVRENQLMSPDYMRRLNESIDKIRMIRRKCHFYYHPSYTLTQIKEVAERVKPKILVLDHLQSIQASPKDQVSSIESLTKLITEVLSFAQRSEIAVICASALNRQGSVRSRYASAGANALRGSSSIEYAATKIWMLRAVGKKQDRGQPCILEGVKDKEAAQFDIPLFFDGSRMSFDVREDKLEEKQKTARKKKTSIKIDEDGGGFAS